MVQLNRQYDRDQTPRESITIKVVGVGGAGSNILDRVMLDGIDSAAMVAINTDVQSLTASVATQKVQLGRNLTRGLGSGGDPELGLAAAEEAYDEIRAVLQGGTVIFLCVGLGGGTGSGATPLIAKIAKEENALVIVFSALPFTFEGKRRCRQAEESLRQLRATADAVVCFENDRMAEIALPRMGIHEAFAAADLTISQSIRSVANLLQRPGLLKIGFDDVSAVLRNGDARGLFGYGEAEGENRAHDSLAKALKNPLMNRGELLENAFHAIVHICGGTNVTLGEVQIIMEELNRHISDETQLFMGIAIDPPMGNRLSVSILSSLGNGSAKPILSQPAKSQYHEDLIPASAAPEPSRLEERRKPEPPLQAKSVEVEDVPEEQIVEPSKAEPSHQFVAAEPTPIRPAPRPEIKAASAASPLKKAEPKQETLQFEPVSRGRFEKSEPTIIDGQDLDVPTFLRKHLRVK
jgi:cell division protein FtsZ